MRRTKAEIYLHLVWATKERLPLLALEMQRPVHRCIAEQATGLGCTVLAVGGTDDHVHLLVRMPTDVSAAKLAQQVKGVSSHFLHERVPRGAGIYWQPGYGVFSVSRSHLDRVVSYVERQLQHHAEARVWGQWEETDEEAPC